MRKFLQIFFAALLGGVVAGGLLIGAVVLLPSPYPAPAAAPASSVALPVNYFHQTSSPARPAPVDLRTAARLATPTVVHIKAKSSGKRREAVKALFQRGREGDRSFRGGEGSGVIYTANGYIITNAHVVETGDDFTVITDDRRTFPASLVGMDEKSDLAVLKIEADQLPHLNLADSDAAEPGQWVLAVGSPLGLTSTVTAGIISAKGRSISLLPDLDAIESFLQTDAAVNPGNSGGPLVTSEGELIGINTAIASRTGRFQGYSFAIPINLVKRIVDDLIAYGSYRRAFLGIEISTLTRNDIKRLRLRDRSEGVVVDAVATDGAAAAAGLRVDDLIIRVGERTIRDLPELTEIIGRAKVGETLKLGIVRNGKERELIVAMTSGE
ncbi:MAG: trypsin-like peptidase domain-containing protein [Bacteroidota bacterium]